jgi:hypothetical protein
MFCNSCGALAQTDDRFCTRCGTPLRGVEPTQANAASDESSRPAEPLKSTATAARPLAASKLETDSDKGNSEARVYRSIGALLICAGAIFFGYAVSKLGAQAAGDRIAYLIGFYFWVPIVVYFVWRSAFTKRRGFGLLLSGVAFLAVTLYQSIAILGEVEDLRRLSSMLQLMVLKAQQGEVLDNSQISTAGRYSPALVAVNDHYARIFSAKHALDSKIQSAKLETLMTAETLQNPLLTDNAIFTLGSLLAAINDADSSISKELKEIPSSGAAALPNEMRAEFERGAERGAKGSGAAFADYFRVERDLVTTATTTLKFVNSRRGYFSIRGNQLLFASRADLDIYNGYLSRIQQLAQRETDLQRRAIEKSNQTVRDLGEVD